MPFASLQRAYGVQSAWQMCHSQPPGSCPPLFPLVSATRATFADFTISFAHTCERTHTADEVLSKRERNLDRPRDLTHRQRETSTVDSDQDRLTSRGGARRPARRCGAQRIALRHTLPKSASSASSYLMGVRQWLPLCQGLTLSPATSKMRLSTTRFVCHAASATTSTGPMRGDALW